MEMLEETEMSNPFRDISVLRNPPFNVDLVSDSYRSSMFTWKRPKSLEPGRLSAVHYFNCVEHLKQVLATKEKENSLLRQVIFKVNQENYQLVKELNGYKGENWEVLNKENKILKRHLARVSKENLFLRTQNLKEINKSVKTGERSSSAKRKTRQQSADQTINI